MPKKKKTTKGRKGRKRRPGSSKISWIVCFLFLGGASFFAAFFLLEQEAPLRTRPQYEEARIEPSRTREYIGLIDHAVYLPKVAIIIDDLGYDLDVARAFMSLGIPLTLSILPMAPHTIDIAREAGRNGFELMIHVPMEPEGFPDLDPGPGALLNSMGPEEIRSLVLQHLDDVPDAKGVNNHMGSSFTERKDNVAALLEEVRNKGLYFVDSKTSAQSVAYITAREMGVPATSRDVFLDSEPSAAAISIQLERLLGLAKQRGEAVGIGHPFPETLKILERQAGRLKTEFQVVTVSELLR